MASVRVMGIGPMSTAWKAVILPLNHTRSLSTLLRKTNIDKGFRERKLDIGGASWYSLVAFDGKRQKGEVPRSLV